MEVEWSKAAGAQPTQPRSDVKHFSLEQANAALPLVERIVRDIVEQHRRVMNLADHRDPDSEQGRACSAARRRAAARLSELANELTAVGCELKDWEYGLVDFPAVHDGREVYLCWKLGEPRVEHWHELHTGFMGRETVVSGEPW